MTKMHRKYLVIPSKSSITSVDLLLLLLLEIFSPLGGSVANVNTIIAHIKAGMAITWQKEGKERGEK